MTEQTKYKSVTELLPKYDHKEQVINTKFKLKYFQSVQQNCEVFKEVTNLTDIIERKIQMNFLDLNLHEKIQQLCQVEFQTNLQNFIQKHEKNIFVKLQKFHIKIKKSVKICQDNQQEKKVIKKGNYTPLKQHKEWYKKILKNESSFRKKIRTAKQKEMLKKQKQNLEKQEKIEQEKKEYEKKRLESNKKFQDQLQERQQQRENFAIVLKQKIENADLSLKFQQQYDLINLEKSLKKIKQQKKGLNYKSLRKFELKYLKTVQNKKAQSLKRVEKCKIQTKKLKPLFDLYQQDQKSFNDSNVQNKEILRLRQKYSQMVKENFMPKLQQSELSKSAVPKKSQENINLDYMQYLDLKKKGLDNLKFARSTKFSKKHKKQSPSQPILPPLKLNYLNSFQRKNQSINYEKKLLKEFQKIEVNLKNTKDKIDLKFSFHKIDNMYVPNNINYDNIYYNTMQQKVKYLQTLNEQN